MVQVVEQRVNLEKETPGRSGNTPPVTPAQGNLGTGGASKFQL